VRSFRVALGHSPVGDKRRRGDGRTPEGRYAIDGRNHRSRYYRSLHISYPSAADIHEARRAGISPGGEIMIHGLPAGAGWIGKHHAGFDWTRGCIAVSNEEIDEIWELVADGTPIEIRP
jgi:murein L,D-transpeptidase YafK